MIKIITIATSEHVDDEMEQVDEVSINSFMIIQQVLSLYQHD
jgi:hypothetical protein